MGQHPMKNEQPPERLEQEWDMWGVVSRTHDSCECLSHLQPCHRSDAWLICHCEEIFIPVLSARIVKMWLIWFQI